MAIDFFISEVINGCLIQIKQINMFTIIKLGFVKGDEADKLMFLCSELVWINNEKQSIETMKELTDLSVISFITDSINAQVEKLNYGKTT